MKSSGRAETPAADGAVREYLAALPPRARQHMTQIRRIVRSVAPDAVESFSYRMPGFRLHNRVFLYYAAFAAHCSIYPMGAAIRRAHAAALKGFKTSTGTIQFPLDKPLPSMLVKRLVKTRVSEVESASALRPR